MAGLPVPLCLGRAARRRRRKPCTANSRYRARALPVVCVRACHLLLAYLLLAYLLLAERATRRSLSRLGPNPVAHLQAA